MLPLARWPLARAGVLEGLARSLVAATGASSYSQLLHAYSTALHPADGGPRPLPPGSAPPPSPPLRDTIFALSSGPGRSAVAVVRISGPDSGGQGARPLICCTCKAPLQPVHTSPPLPRPSPPTTAAGIAPTPSRRPRPAPPAARGAAAASPGQPGLPDSARRGAAGPGAGVAVPWPSQLHRYCLPACLPCCWLPCTAPAALLRLSVPSALPAPILHPLQALRAPHWLPPRLQARTALSCTCTAAPRWCAPCWRPCRRCGCAPQRRGSLRGGPLMRASST